MHKRSLLSRVTVSLSGVFVAVIVNLLTLPHSQDGPAIIHHNVYSTDLVKEKALNYLSEACKSAQPFFLTVAPIGPHSCKLFPNRVVYTSTHASTDSRRGKQRCQIFNRYPPDGHSRFSCSSCNALPLRTASTERIVQSRCCQRCIMGQESA